MAEDREMNEIDNRPDENVQERTQDIPQESQPAEQYTGEVPVEEPPVDIYDEYNTTDPLTVDDDAKFFDEYESESVQMGPVAPTAENKEHGASSAEMPGRSSAPDGLDSVAGPDPIVATPSDTMNLKPGASAKEAPASADGNEGLEKTGESGGRYVVSNTLPPLELPKGFAMDTPGILTCTEPVTAESIRALKAFVNEHHAELVMTGKWAEPTAISFSPHDPVTGQRTTQKLDSELAEALSEAWVFSRMEARAGSLELVPDRNGKSPLDILQDLSHIHMWGGFALAGDVDVQRNMLMSSHPMHISVGITGDGN